MKKIMFALVLSGALSTSIGIAYSAVGDDEISKISGCNGSACILASRAALAAVSALPKGPDKDAALASYIKAVTGAGQSDHTIAAQLSVDVSSAAGQMSNPDSAVFAQSIAAALAACNSAVAGSCDQIDTAAVAPTDAAPVGPDFDDDNAS